MRTNSIDCIHSIAKSIENSIKFSSNPKELPGLNPRLGSAVSC